MNRLEARAVRKTGLFFSFLFALSLLGGAWPGWVWGQQPKVQLLSLQECWRIALEKNKDIHKAKEYRNAVMGRYIEERSAALPQFAVNAYISHSRDESQKALYRGLFPFEQELHGAEITVSQPLYTFGRIGAAIRAAKIGMETAEDQLRIYQQAALRDVTAAFQDVLLSRELYVLAVQNLEQKARTQREARRKLAAGVATDYDVLAADVAVENARPEVIRTENLIRISREKLRFILGVERQEVDAAGTLVTSLEPRANYEETLETALKKRPELSDLRKRIQVYEELVKIYKAGTLPGSISKRAGVGDRLTSGP